MRKKFSIIYLLFPTSLILLFFVSCGPAVFLAEPSTPSATFGPLASPNTETPTSTATQTTNANCPFEKWPCPSDSLTLTAEMRPTLDAMMTAARASVNLTADTLSKADLTLTAEMGLTLTAIPSSTSPAGVTIFPQVGDLGWGSVYGIIRDSVTNLPIEGASIRCEHSSYTSQYPCSGITTTNADGIYSFTTIFFHDTDRIVIFVDAPGYAPLRFEQNFFVRPELHADLGLVPLIGETSTPTAYLMCTAPACSGGVLACGSLNGCLGGCGTVCLTITSIP
jgi:hypothetical protein